MSICSRLLLQGRVHGLVSECRPGSHASLVTWQQQERRNNWHAEYVWVEMIAQVVYDPLSRRK